MQSAVIVFPGSNCDRDAQTALERITGTAPHMVWHGDAAFPKVDLIVLPGGFSYGDYLRCGAIAAHSPVVKEVVARAQAGVPTLGICNGFHVLTESGLLPGILMRNEHLRFACKWVDLRVEDSQSIFTCGYKRGQRIRVPIAHGDGNYFADAGTLDRIEAEGRVAFRYVDPEGEATEAGNPNGSQRNIAGLFNETRTVLGMMPHPERAADPLLGGEDGRRLFEGLVQALS